MTWNRGPKDNNVCEYCDCTRKAKYFMGWVEEGEKQWGMVCATHDKYLGRKNLVGAGLSLEEAIQFEKTIME
uniref:Uncharacterized protein n=1 Tax=viral metagenome TaxID=1070528 RepID=A0A6M3IYJ3_9ZZZZ